ncbi:type III PLP-dependent enzyme [Edwardsiella tarda]|uniref:type III PLP-dependent enzyme n=1 Tax=Edwardsiella tarda TaxID=636 RepID=UPI0034DDB7BB
MTPAVRREIRKLQQQHSPFCAYLYDLTALRERIADMKHRLPIGCELFYAAKANAEAPILRTLAPWVDGFEAASGGELAWLAQQSLDSKLLFGGPGKLTSELALACELKIDALHVESLGELQRLAMLAEQRRQVLPLLLRMNIPLPGGTDTPLMMAGRPTPFGLDTTDLAAALRLIADCRWLRLRGFHFHLLSHQLSVDNHLALIQHCLTQVGQWCRQFQLSIEMVNLGGGFGINYRDPSHHFDWDDFCQRLPAVRHACQATSWLLRFECGRYISAPCGYYVMEVLDIKRNLGEWFAIGHGGTHHFRTPVAQGHDHPFQVVRRETPAQIRDQRVTLVGQLCTPKDVLARRQPISALAPGDWLVFPLAGAYAWNISHRHFLMHAAPHTVWLA